MDKIEPTLYPLSRRADRERALQLLVNRKVRELTKHDLSDEEHDLSEACAFHLWEETRETHPLRTYLRSISEECYKDYRRTTRYGYPEPRPSLSHICKEAGHSFILKMPDLIPNLERLHERVSEWKETEDPRARHRLARLCGTIGIPTDVKEMTGVSYRPDEDEYVVESDYPRPNTEELLARLAALTAFLKKDLLNFLGERFDEELLSVLEEQVRDIEAREAEEERKMMER